MVKLADSCAYDCVVAPIENAQNNKAVYTTLSEDRMSLRNKRYEKYIGHGVYVRCKFTQLICICQ